MKVATFVAAPEGQETAAFLQWFTETYLPLVKSQALSLRGLVMRTSRPALRTRRVQQHRMTDDMAFDVLLEAWLPSIDDFHREILPCETSLRDMGCRYASFAILSRLQKDPRSAEAGPTGRRPAFTYLNTLRWKPEISPETAWNEWEKHAAIALRVQPRMSKYEQNLVTEILSSTERAPAIDAYTDLSFATVDDFSAGFEVTSEEVQHMSRVVSVFAEAFLTDAQPA